MVSIFGGRLKLRTRFACYNYSTRKLDTCIFCYRQTSLNKEETRLSTFSLPDTGSMLLPSLHLASRVTSISEYGNVSLCFYRIREHPDFFLSEHSNLCGERKHLIPLRVYNYLFCKFQYEDISYIKRHKR